LVQSLGRLEFQEDTGYGKRVLEETTLGGGGYKSIIGGSLRVRLWPGQQAKAAIAVEVHNHVLDTGRPKSSPLGPATTQSSAINYL
jgi:hypothetical protein